jgi:ribosomal protein S18 acetylase RimI-like enzyme
LITFRRAHDGDVAAIVALREEATTWLLGRGIVQWRPGEVAPSDVRDWMATGRMYVAVAPDGSQRGGGIVGAVRLAWSDEPIWGVQSPESGYLHALMTARSARGHGLGARLLRHAEDAVRRSGRPLVRLDCARDNDRLRAYYRAQGYAEVGEREWAGEPGWNPVALLEKPLSSPGS